MINFCDLKMTNKPSVKIFPSVEDIIEIIVQPLLGRHIELQCQETS